MQKFLRPLLIVVTCLTIGYLSGMVTRENIPNWYVHLKKPSFNPPNWVFFPVWTALYIMMGIAAGRVWNLFEKQPKEVKTALQYFIIQLGLNFLWSYIFFGLHNLLLASIEVILLWLMIFETYKKFDKLDKLAAKMLIPYLAWVSFASVLTVSVWYLNR